MTQTSSRHVYVDHARRQCAATAAQALTPAPHGGERRRTLLGQRCSLGYLSQIFRWHASEMSNVK